MLLLNIDGYLLKKAIISGSNRIIQNKEFINSLNVFPVPDGDTGTNMSLTILSGAKEVEKVNSKSVKDIAKALANGSLMGARGNSGVILSQLLRGFYKGLENIDIATSDDIIIALKKSVEMAYKAVIKPKEGTILTVANAICERAKVISQKTSDLTKIFKLSIDYGYSVLEKTTDMLPQLKQAGVVDAGALGLMNILTGAMECINFESVKLVENLSLAPQKVFEFKGRTSTEIKFLYCTEFFIKGKNFDSNVEDKLKCFLQTNGDSIVLIVEDDIIRVHLHTNNPGSVLQEGIKLGTLSEIKIENMSIQHTEAINFVKSNIQIKEFGFISVAQGSGFEDLFLNLGVDKVISGGQSLNPSTEEILNAIDCVNAKNIIFFPNNKNIIMACNQARDLCNDKNIIVLNTTNIPQSITAILSYMPDNSLTENISLMEDRIKNIKTGMITKASKSTNIDGLTIEKGNFISLIEDKICLNNESLEEISKNIIDKLIDENEDTSLLTIYYGEDVSSQNAKELATYAESKYPYIDVELNFGGQPIYYYIIGAE